MYLNFKKPGKIKTLLTKRIDLTTVRISSHYIVRHTLCRGYRILATLQHCRKSKTFLFLGPPMNSNKVDIRNSTLFPWHFQLIAALILVAGFALLVEKPVMGCVLVVAAGFILTAADGTEIDLTQNRYREYSAFYFLLRSGKWKKFPGAEKIFINQAKSTTKAYTAHTNHGSVFTRTEYNGYLKLMNGEKVHLLNSTKKEKLTTTLTQVASLLRCPLQDNTLI